MHIHVCFDFKYLYLGFKFVASSKIQTFCRLFNIYGFLYFHILSQVNKLKCP